MIAKLTAMSDKNKSNITPTTIIRKYVKNMNDVKSKKHDMSPNNNEKHHYLVNGLAHCLTLKEQKYQKNFQ